MNSGCALCNCNLILISCVLMHGGILQNSMSFHVTNALYKTTDTKQMTHVDALQQQYSKRDLLQSIAISIAMIIPITVRHKNTCSCALPLYMHTMLLYNALRGSQSHTPCLCGDVWESNFAAEYWYSSWERTHTQLYALQNYQSPVLYWSCWIREWGSQKHRRANDSRSLSATPSAIASPRDFRSINLVVINATSCSFSGTQNKIFNETRNRPVKNHWD